MPTKEEKRFERRSAESQGIDVNRRFVFLASDRDGCKTGDILTISRDDGSSCPYFKNERTEDSSICTHWDSLYYATGSRTKVNTMYPKTSKAAAQEIKLLEKKLETCKKTIEKAEARKERIESALRKLRQL